ncbi:hypothetical protein [uncultured Arthrobacter sp.]|uniref:hypothetical protein n=1 Tax=uncultured Arthrobacter sp. TaxID=114050 RepID=UPI0026388DCC|nr:hypothetical protein [uncultured Arthrobacter sp.]
MGLTLTTAMTASPSFEQQRSVSGPSGDVQEPLRYTPRDGRRDQVSAGKLVGDDAQSFASQVVLELQGACPDPLGHVVQETSRSVKATTASGPFTGGLQGDGHHVRPLADRKVDGVRFRVYPLDLTA